MDSFEKVIWQIVAAIPAGRIMTYGQVAKQAGYPNHSRQVGRILKKLPNGTKLPWHRVINAQGKISFPEGGEQYLRQKERLLNEGVTFKGNKVDLKQCAIEY